MNGNRCVVTAFSFGLGLALLSTSKLEAYDQYQFQARGRTYTITTTAISGSGFSFSGHWMYQPSVLIPSTLTGNQYVMLFNSNRYANQAQASGEAIWKVQSANGYSGWSAPTPILENSAVDNICDMADARPIWTGTQWYVFVQAVAGPIAASCGNELPGIFVAAGPALAAGQLQWVKQPGTNHALEIAGGGTSTYIAEDQQWFNTAPYGGSSSWPLMMTYNNWMYSADPNALFSYLFTGDLSSAGYWYGPVHSPVNGPPWFLNRYYYPDAILLGDLDAPSQGNPGIGLQSTCQNTDHRYQYVVGIAYFPNPQSNMAHWGDAYAGPLESTSSDGNGPRMFRPRLARNEYGFIPLATGSSGSVSLWSTYLYYNPGQINNNAADECNLYSNHFGASSFSVSQFQVFEQ